MCNTTQQSWRSWSISFMYNCTPIFRPLTLYGPLPHPAPLHRGPRCTAVKHVKQLYMGSITLVEIAYVIYIAFHLFLPQTWLPYPQSPYLTTHDLFAYKFMLCKSSETDKSYLLHIFFLRCILTNDRTQDDNNDANAGNDTWLPVVLAGLSLKAVQARSM